MAQGWKTGVICKAENKIPGSAARVFFLIGEVRRGRENSGVLTRTLRRLVYARSFS